MGVAATHRRALYEKRVYENRRYERRLYEGGGGEGWRRSNQEATRRDERMRGEGGGDMGKLIVGSGGAMKHKSGPNHHSLPTRCPHTQIFEYSSMFNW